MCVIGGLAGKFTPTPTVADVSGMCGRIVLCCEQVRKTVALGFHQQDFRAGSNRMRPLDIQGDFQAPAGVVARVVRASGLVDLAEAAIGGGACGEAKLLAEKVQIIFSRGQVIGIDDGNRRAASGGIAGGKTIGCLHLSRTPTDPGRVGEWDDVSMAVSITRRGRAWTDRFTPAFSTICSGRSPCHPPRKKRERKYNNQGQLDNTLRHTLLLFR